MYVGELPTSGKKGPRLAADSCLEMVDDVLKQNETLLAIMGGYVQSMQVLFAITEARLIAIRLNNVEAPTDIRYEVSFLNIKALKQLPESYASKKNAVEVFDLIHTDGASQHVSVSNGDSPVFKDLMSSRAGLAEIGPTELPRGSSADRARDGLAKLEQLTGAVHPRFGNLVGAVEGKGSPKIRIYPSGVVCGSKEYELDQFVSAQVTVGGEVLVNYRPTVTRTLLAAAIPGVGTAIFGLASRKKITRDTRTAHFSIAHPKWSHTIEVDLGKVPEIETLAVRINTMADQLAVRVTTKSSEPSNVDVGPDLETRLKKVQSLLNLDLISTEEAESLRREILKEI